MSNRHQTKIIATLGPATSDPKYLEKVLRSGADLVRINFSHGTEESQRQLFRLARECAQAIDREIGIIADLQGPKIRIEKFQNHAVELQPGNNFSLDARLATSAGNEHEVGITYKDLPADVSAGDTLLLDDGRIELCVMQCNADRIDCKVVSGGTISNNKGINRLGGGLSAKALTEKDKRDLQIALSEQADYIALSFPRNATDIQEARQLIQQAGGNCCIIAKIERKEAVDNIDDIILAADAVMVARGDLGVEISNAEVPGVQKYIINRARALDKAVITATQMMESMIHNSIPTRAEASDVANAVLDGTDAVMLSAETATGDHPHKVVISMAQICESAEKYPMSKCNISRGEFQFSRVDEAIAMAAMYTANHLSIKAIVTLTESGSTPLWMSRIRSEIPIFALSRHTSSQRKMTLYRGVYPIEFDPTVIDRRNVNRLAIDELVQRGLVTKGDLVIITKGNLMGELGGTNAMKIVRVGGQM